MYRCPCWGVQRPPSRLVRSSIPAASSHKIFTYTRVSTSRPEKRALTNAMPTREPDEIFRKPTKYPDHSTGIDENVPIHVFRVVVCASFVGSRRNDDVTDKYTRREATKTTDTFGRGRVTFCVVARQTITNIFSGRKLTKN